MDYNISQGACILTNSGDNYTGTLPINVLSYVNNGVYIVRLSATNTTMSPTLNLNGLGAKTITAKNGAGIPIGDMSINSWHMVMFVVSANVFVLLTPEVAVSGSAITGTGTTNYVTKFTASNTIGNSAIQDDGSNVSINNSINALYKLYINSNVLVGLGVVNNASSGGNHFGISGGATNANTGSNIGVFGNALLSSGGTNLGVRGQSASQTFIDSDVLTANGTNIGGYFQANASSGISYGLVATADALVNQPSATFIGAYIRAEYAGTKYSVRLVDGTEGTGKFLKSITSIGQANWAALAISDITASLGTALQVVRVNAGATALEYATISNSDVFKVGTGTYTPNATILTGRQTATVTVTGAITTDVVVANINDAMKADFVATGSYFLDLQVYVSSTNTVTLSYLLSGNTTFGVTSSIKVMVQR